MALTGALAEAFAKQAGFCRLFQSPFTALMCEATALAFDATSAAGRRVLAWPGEAFADALMMRVTGAFHALVRAGRAPGLAALYPPAPLPDLDTLVAAVRDVLADPALDAFVERWLGSPPQTNEVARSGVLWPGMMVIAAACRLPLRLFELGASAGLNLQMDRFGYRLAELAAGDAASGVQLAPAWTGPPPPAAAPQVIARAGVDINPLDVTDDAVVERLLAFVWPDQPERLTRAAAAIAIARAQPPALTRADAADWVEAEVAPQPGSVAVVYHSIAAQYFPEDTRRRIAAHLAAMGSRATPEAPLAWLHYEMDDASVAELPTLRLTLWSGQRKAQLLARAHPHGTFVHWQ